MLRINLTCGLLLSASVASCAIQEPDPGETSDKSDYAFEQDIQIRWIYDYSDRNSIDLLPGDTVDFSSTLKVVPHIASGPSGELKEISMSGDFINLKSDDDIFNVEVSPVDEFGTNAAICHLWRQRMGEGNFQHEELRLNLDDGSYVTVEPGHFSINKEDGAIELLDTNYTEQEYKNTDFNGTDWTVELQSPNSQDQYAMFCIPADDFGSIDADTYNFAASMN